MTETVAELLNEYSRAFIGYAKDKNEADLHWAYELGREAVGTHLNLLELGRIHHEALSSAFMELSTDVGIEDITRRGADFLSEALSAFEMVRRGYHEIREVAGIERQHSDQLSQLADTFIEINTAHSVASLLGNTTQRAMEILGATCCVATIETTAEASDALWVASAPESAEGWRELMQSPEGAQLTSLISEEASSRGATTVHRSRHHLSEREAAWLGVALVDHRRRSLGTLQLFDEGKDFFSEIDRSILLQLAQMTAVALANFQVYEREHLTAVTLQRALLPSRFAKLPYATVAARYVPGEAGLNVGGDWYDIAELPGNRIAIAMGDVVGRGARAAAVMGRVRTAWRAYALRDNPPDLVMESLNRLIQDLDDDHFSTVVHILADWGDHHLQIVNAGHPPPLLISPDGRNRYLEEGLSIPLGVLSTAGYHQQRIEVEPGSIVVLYTDGLIERPEAPLDEGLQRLSRSVQGPVMDVEALCDQIIERMLLTEPTDDVAILAFRLDES
jgi:serine phosphatase RsbU (regulator of sigma subunit)